MVAGMVVFENGRPLRSPPTSKFTIKTVEGTDDYASMQEVLSRRSAPLPGPGEGHRTRRSAGCPT